jgi:sugar phosphate isomerase/epimerase
MYGIQMYSVRDLTQTDMQGALKQVSRLGYRKVEFAGFFGHNAKTVKGWLSRYGLTASGTHTGLRALDEDFDGVAAYHKALDCTLLTVPYENPRTQAELRMAIEKLKMYSRRLAERGITMAYHNHAHEFQPVEGGISQWNALVTQTDIPLQIDTFWVYAAGQDPVAWMKKLHAQGRLPVIHLKDGLAGGEGKPLGMGTAPVRAVHDAAYSLGVPMVVESETLTPSGMDEARICMEYLTALEQGK